MKKFLYYLWKGIFIIISICTLPIVWNYIKDSFAKNGNSILSFCVTSIFMLIIIGLFALIGWSLNELIECFNPKNKKQ